MLDYMNVNNYKPCVTKQTEVWLCKPPTGVVIFNKFTDVDIIQKIATRIPSVAKKYFLTREESLQILYNAPEIWQFIVANDLVVDQNEFVMYGTRDELQIIKCNDAFGYFDVFIDGNWVNLRASINKRFEDYNNNEKVMHWYKARVRSGVKQFAMPIPMKEKGCIQVGRKVYYYNYSGASHGKGDFVVCNNINGRPDSNSMHVVNGSVFANMYNNQGWADYIKSDGVSTKDPYELFISQASQAIVDWATIENLVKNFNLTGDTFADIKQAYDSNIVRNWRFFAICFKGMLDWCKQNNLSPKILNIFIDIDLWMSEQDMNIQFMFNNLDFSVKDYDLRRENCDITLFIYPNECELRIVSCGDNGEKEYYSPFTNEKSLKDFSSWFSNTLAKLISSKNSSAGDNIGYRVIS